MAAVRLEALIQDPQLHSALQKSKGRKKPVEVRLCELLNRFSPERRRLIAERLR